MFLLKPFGREKGIQKDLVSIYQSPSLNLPDLLSSNLLEWTSFKLKVILNYGDSICRIHTSFQVTELINEFRFIEWRVLERIGF